MRRCWPLSPASAVAPPAAAVTSVSFSGSFDTGNLSQWTFVVRAYTDRIRVVDSPVRDGGFSGRFEVRDGDPLVAGGQRSEVMWGTSDKPTLREGNDYYFGWSTHFAPDFPSPSDPTNTGHCNFLQWRNSGTGAPPIALSCRNERVQINYSAKCGGWNTRLVRGGWHDFVVRVRFNDDPALGFVELWHKAPNESGTTKKIGRCALATLNRDTTSYLKLGYYRRADETRTGVIRHDGMRVGTTYDAVAPTTGSTPWTTTTVSGSTPWTTTTVSGDDVTPPVVTAPRETLPTLPLGSATLPVRIAWSASDNSGRVAAYEVQRSVDGGSFTAVTLASASTTTMTQALPPAHDYRYRVRATDAAGNTSAWATAAGFDLAAHQEWSSSIDYDGMWSTEGVSGAFGGSVRHGSHAGHDAALTFSGSDVSWVSTRGPNRGKAEVWLDGALAATVDLYASTTSTRETVFARSGLSLGSSHVLEIRRATSRNESSRGTRVDVDAFGVIR